MVKLNCAVIGVGYLGRFHAQKYRLLDNVNLIAVCDPNLDAAKRVAQELETTAVSDYKTILDKVDAVSIAASTQAHYAIAKDCLQNGVHVLLEKPMTETVEQANALIDLAAARELKLQIGHMERFNPAQIALSAHLDCPLFIDSQRLAPFNPRGADVNVILDLMIHDIDLIQTMVNSPIATIDAHGSPILSGQIDIANARITFENRCVANVVASRISYKTERKTRIFQRHSYLSVDYHQKKLAIFRTGEGELFPGISNVDQQELTFENTDALLEEIRAFITSIESNTLPIVTGEHGRDALVTAVQISQLITQNLAHHVAQ